MDWAYRSDDASRDGEPPEPRPLAVFWRGTSATGRVITCAGYPTGSGGVELRVGYSYDGMIKTALVADVDQAQHLASAWLEAMQGQGGFSLI
jgi:hypothetical protein